MRRRWLTLPGRSSSRISADLQDELRFHLDMRANDLMQQGMSDAEARRAAEREFGDLEYTTRYCLTEDTMSNAETRRADFLAELRHDAAYSLRAMRRAPGFTTVALFTLALGIGATTAIFSAVNGLLLRDLPYRDANEVVRLWGSRVTSLEGRGQISAADLADVRERQRSFSAVGAFAGGGATFVGAEESVALPGVRLEPEVWDVLGVQPALGRLFTAADVGSQEPVVVVSHAMWMRWLGADSSVIGTGINLGGRTRTVLGVLPPGFYFPTAAQSEVFSPYDMAANLADPVRARRFRHLGAVARLRPDVTPVQASADVRTIMQALEQDLPGTNTDMTVRVVGIRDAVTGDFRPALLLLFGASALVLLIACANVAGMLLARGVVRQPELAVRAALGAGRGRLVRQLLTESMVLALGGGLAGLVLANWGAAALGAAARALFPLASLARIDATVLGTALLVTLGCGVVFGLAPALSAAGNLQASLRDGARGSAGGRQRLRTVLVTGQVALSVMLLVGAGLLTRSLVALQRTDLGYDLDSALTFTLGLAGPRYADVASHDRYFDALYDGLRAIPGVTAAGGAGSLPLRGGSTASLAINGKPVPESSLPEVGYQPVSDDYFTALSVPLRSGRFFTPADHDSAAGVVIISEGLARQHFPGEDPLGAQVRLGPDASAPWNTVVGVVGDVGHGILGGARPTAYVSARQDHWGSAAVVVRTTTDPMTILPAVRRVVRGLDPGIPLSSVNTLRGVQGEGMVDRRLTMQLLTAFSLVAVVLAAVGVYGVMAFLVAARSREIGVRMALGARPRSVFGLVMGQGLVPAIAGLGLGTVGALALSRVIAGMLYGVGVTDGATFAAVAVVVLAATIGACLVPARRATRIDPIEAMRAD